MNAPLVTTFTIRLSLRLTKGGVFSHDRKPISGKCMKAGEALDATLTSRGNRWFEFEKAPAIAWELGAQQFESKIKMR